MIGAALALCTGLLGFVVPARFTLIMFVYIFKSCECLFIVVFKLLTKQYIHRMQIIGTSISLLGTFMSSANGGDE